MPQRQIYLLSPRLLSPETIAVAFAKTSRAPESFKEIAAELSDDQSAQFHEKWVVGYGHASVAEHAVLHFALENVSRIAVEAIESSRLASYTEKSTRYQKWGQADFTIPPELDQSPLRAEFMKTAQFLFSTYAQSLEPIKSLVLCRFPRREQEGDEAYDRRIRSQYVDSCRFLLPAAANANVGMTANARVIEMLIRKMLSHPLQEVRQIGGEMKEAAKAEIPTLVKYADANPYLLETAQELERRDEELPSADFQLSPTNWCSLIDYDQDGEYKILAAALYRFHTMPFVLALARVKSMPQKERTELADALFKRLTQFDVPLRELEYSVYTFDLVMDQGAYAEFKRHRMMTQTAQRLSARLGYATPLLVTEAGFGGQYAAAMESALAMYEKLFEINPHIAQYIVPNGFNRRVLAQFNLREAFAFCQLRTAAHAHFSIRRLAQKVFEELARAHPLLTKYMHLHAETWQDVEENYFSTVG